MTDGRSVIVVEKGKGRNLFALAVWNMRRRKENIFMKPNGYFFVWNWIICTLEFVWVFKNEIQFQNDFFNEIW